MLMKSTEPDPEEEDIFTDGLLKHKSILMKPQLNRVQSQRLSHHIQNLEQHRKEEK